MTACLVLFAGGGGSTLGAHRAGYECFGVEWDAAAVAVHNAHAGPCVQTDVRAREWVPGFLSWLDGRPLTVWASPPCQAWSTAGKRKGAQDERNGWPWVWELVDDLRAAGVKVVALVTENVPGMLHHLSRAACDRGHRPAPESCPGCYWSAVVVPEVARRFASVTWRVLDAADYGVPQHRERLIMAAGAKAIRWPTPSHDEPGALPFVPTWETALGLAAPCTTVTATEGRGCATDARRASRTLGRRATVEECALLQGWPEVVPHLALAPRVEDRYRIVGNAVPPALAEAVMRALAPLASPR